MPDLAKVADRESLKPRRDPYWSRIRKGCYLGFRKMTPTSEGTWIARCLDEHERKQVYKALGDFSELPTHRRHDAAKVQAEEFFTHLGKGGIARAVTVRDACDKYVQHLRDTKTNKAANDAKARFDAYVLDNGKFADIELAKLLPVHLETWRKALRARPTTSGPNRGKQRTDSSLNRDMTCLRAALNLAYKDGWLTSDFAWRGKLLPIRDADRQRDLYIDQAQRRKLVAAAPADLAQFLRGLCLVPLRPGALAALTAGSYDKRLKTLTIGKDKAGRDRKIALPQVTAEFFAKCCKDKLPNAPLLPRSNGSAWDKDAWKYPVRDAVSAGKLPEGVTAYTIRHSVITDLIHAGLDTLTVAQLSGTSVLMIERHYGHLTNKHARKALARLTL